MAARTAAAFLAGLVVLCSAPSQACPVYIALPEDTLADRPLAAETVVLARPAADAPFEFAAVRRLAGAGTGDLPQLRDDLFRLVSLPSHLGHVWDLVEILERRSPSVVMSA